MKSLGLDIGTNSVGSAWVDTDRRVVRMGVSVFPAGVEESDTKRGAPRNQARRGHRLQRRTTKRRAVRKHQMRRFLLEMGWMPKEPDAEKRWLDESNPWILRKEGLERELSAHEFGRVLLHMAQRRGAYGVDVGEEEDKDVGKVKEGISETRKAMSQYKARTFGELMAKKYEERRKKIGRRGKTVRGAIRNRTKASGEGTYEFCADRAMMLDEFAKLWDHQKSFGGPLARELTDRCRKELNNPDGYAAWRYKGILFDQRKTYWDVGTMARCDLEPTDMKCPKADMYAQEFLILETVNNIRITPRGALKRPLKDEERAKVIAALMRQKTASEATVRKALEISRGERKAAYTLSLEKDPERGLNTNWFHREVVEAIGQQTWEEMEDKQRDSINRAILKFDPQEERDQERLRNGCRSWWNFTEEQTSQLIEAWKRRGKVDKRVNYSRRAIKNLLPYMRKGATVNEARKLFAKKASGEQRRRYSFGAKAGNKRLRRYMEKHADLLPPAPEDISNPVVRKAIHEVRRHVQAYMREFGCKPDRVVVELAREARQSAVVRNRQLAQNRAREQERKKTIEEIRKYVGEWDRLSRTQQWKAVKRVLLSKEQKYRCAYCGDEQDTITEEAAARGCGVEEDHIIPESRGGNSYLSNLVVCHTRCNRGKGNKTPREWLTDEQFARLEQRLKHLEKENKVKWDNLHKEVPDLDGFIESQLSDAAYAARQVAGWLEKTLYGDKKDGRRHVFTSKGRYTAILRRDWRLLPGGRDGGDKDEKNRADHRHHAIDGVVIALSGPERLSELAHAAERWELARAEGKAAPEREPLDAPWGDRELFRAEVMREWRNLVVAHRPEKRKITGALHNDTQFGPVLDEKGSLTGEFVIRKCAVELAPNHLRVPEGGEQLRAELEQCRTKAERRKIRANMLALPDVRAGKSGVVRDRWFREELRQALRSEGMDPDDFTSKQIKELIKRKGLTLESGVPVRRVVLLRKPSVIGMKRKRWNAVSGHMEYDENPSSVRYYEPQNNHHIEIRQNKKGRWAGEVVTNFNAAKRVRPSKNSGQVPQAAVDREDTEDGEFVMSLSIGEMVYMKHPEKKQADYFVVFKIDGNGYMHFTPHWDAGRAKETERCTAREDIGLPAGKLQKLGAEQGNGPEKVWVGPLGNKRTLYRD